MLNKKPQQIAKHGFRCLVNEVYRFEDEISLTSKNGEDLKRETDLIETWFYDVCTFTIDHSGDYSYSNNLNILIYTSPDGSILNSKPHDVIRIETKEVKTILIPKNFNYVKIKFINNDTENSTKFRYILIGVIKYR